MLKLILVLLWLQFSDAKFTKKNVVNLSNVRHGRIHTSTITTSGFSSGGAMTTMMQYMYSSKIKGNGVFAGVPFGAMYNISGRPNIFLYAINVLSVLPPLPRGRNAKFLQQQAKTLSRQGLIDPIVNLKRSKTYVFQGGKDPINKPAIGYSDLIAQMGKYFGSNVKYKYLPAASHCTPTNSYGGVCSNFLSEGGLCNCDYEGVFDMFSHLYGLDYTPPKSSSTPTTGKFSTFNQSPFTPSGKASKDFMNKFGGIYVPLACQAATSVCKLHVAFHGCGQSLISNLVGDQWAEHAGYFQVADANNIVVVFPRVAVAAGSLTPVKTNYLCWDWKGYTTLKPSLKDAPQVKSVANILNAVIGSEVF